MILRRRKEASFLTGVKISCKSKVWLFDDRVSIIRREVGRVPFREKDLPVAPEITQAAHGGHGWTESSSPSRAASSAPVRLRHASWETRPFNFYSLQCSLK